MARMAGDAGSMKILVGRVVSELLGLPKSVTTPGEPNSIAAGLPSSDATILCTLRQSMIQVLGARAPPTLRRLSHTSPVQLMTQ